MAFNDNYYTYNSSSTGWSYNTYTTIPTYIHTAPGPDSIHSCPGAGCVICAKAGAPEPETKESREPMAREWLDQRVDEICELAA